MTTAEFKEKYPHLAHLEGNSLWDAMSKAVFLETGGKVIETQEELEKVLLEKFTDNRTFKDRFNGFGLLIPNGKGVDNIPHVSYEYKAEEEGKPDVKNMSFDELANWVKKKQGKK